MHCQMVSYDEPEEQVRTAGCRHIGSGLMHKLLREPTGAEGSRHPGRGRVGVREAHLGGDQGRGAGHDRAAPHRGGQGHCRQDGKGPQHRLPALRQQHAVGSGHRRPVSRRAALISLLGALAAPLVAGTCACAVGSTAPHDVSSTAWCKSPHNVLDLKRQTVLLLWTCKVQGDRHARKHDCQMRKGKFRGQPY